MLVRRISFSIMALAGFCLAAPASAQFFLKPADLSGAPVTGTEPGMIGPGLPGATPAELRAALVWSLRAALNVAALQCQFEPTLLTLENYNALLDDHEVELRQSYGTLEKYFIKAAKNTKAGQTELDRFGTRIYSSFSTVSGQLSFCQTAAAIGRDAVFAPRGKLGDVAIARMRELRSSLAAWGEQYFRSRRVAISLPAQRPLPPFGDDKCWRKGEYYPRKCGPLTR
ncbi:hypothetical protein [Sphingomonas pokkalii]|uniref:TIGR02301 family protein n=1 Tax=Sphingomonas pokkalii TaxID=2175090 RepID=A0A2U0SE87_9SPHN|nr:hypothetical protein [Sphingomonas pokkalii]PVX29604.1 hypothetical protein DD559_09955 [Sphingomonas pokkalii]